MDVLETIIKSLLLFALFFAVLIGITGCQTAGATLDAVGNVRHNIAEKETETHIKGLCSGNFNVIRERFGKNDEEWQAILNICESGQNSTSRTVE